MGDAEATSQSPLTQGFQEHDHQSAVEHSSILNGLALEDNQGSSLPPNVMSEETIMNLPQRKRQARNHQDSLQQSRVPYVQQVKAKTHENSGKLVRPSKLRPRKTKAFLEREISNDALSVLDTPRVAELRHPEHRFDSSEGKESTKARVTPNSKASADQNDALNTINKSSKSLMKSPESLQPIASVPLSASYEPSTVGSRVSEPKMSSGIVKNNSEFNSELETDLDDQAPSGVLEQYRLKVNDMDDENGESDGPSSEEISEDLPIENRQEPEMLELFGQEAAWKTLLEGVHKIDVLNVGRSRTKNLPKMNTKHITHLVRKTESTRKLFKRIADRPASDNELEGLEVQLAEGLLDIEIDINRVDETAARSERLNLMKDIYNHAIPRLILMLRWALQCRKLAYSHPTDLDTIESIISIQDTILSLDSKIRQWNTKEHRTSSIVKPLRDIRAAFAAKMAERRQLLEKQQIESSLVESHERRVEKIKRDKEENRRRRKEQCLRIDEDLNRKHALLFGPTQFKTQASDLQEHYEPSSHHTTATDHWSDEQNLALIVQLQNPESRHLPGQ